MPESMMGQIQESTATTALGSLNQLLRDHGWPAVIISVMLGMFLGWLKSPLLEGAADARHVSTTIDKLEPTIEELKNLTRDSHDLMMARNHVFEQIVLSEMTHCVESAKDDLSRQNCIRATTATCADLEAIAKSVPAPTHGATK